MHHVIRAASLICEEPEFVVIGSQAIHATMIDVDHPTLVKSMEVDLYPKHAPEKAERLNVIGELSPFHETYGYYADGVDETTAVLPSGWVDRLIPISGPLTTTSLGFMATGWCLEIHDLSVSKLYAARQKDVAFFEALVSLGVVDHPTLLERLKTTKMSVTKRRLVHSFVANAFLK